MTELYIAWKYRMIKVVINEGYNERYSIA